jgi:hypothetical protein
VNKKLITADRSEEELSEFLYEELSNGDYVEESDKEIANVAQGKVCSW